MVEVSFCSFFFALLFKITICGHINTTTGVLTKGLYLLTAVQLMRKRISKVALLFYNFLLVSSTPACFHVLTLPQKLILFSSLINTTFTLLLHPQSNRRTVILQDAYLNTQMSEGLLSLFNKNIITIINIITKNGNKISQIAWKNKRQILLQKGKKWGCSDLKISKRKVTAAHTEVKRESLWD